MKQVASALATYLNGMVTGGGAPSGATLFQFDTYTITTIGGVTLLYTTANFPITAPSSTIFDAPKIGGVGNLWFAGMKWAPFAIDDSSTRATAHWKVGLGSDSWQVKFAPRSSDLLTDAVFPDRIGNVPWIQAAASGMLDDADCVVARAYFSSMPDYDPSQGGSQAITGFVPLGTIIVFRGYLGQVDLTSSTATLTVNDYRQLLQQQMPRNLYGASCRHRLGDARCTVSLAGFTAAATAAAGSTQAIITASAAVTAPGGSGTFANGVLTMTGGANAGFSRFVTSWTGGNVFGLLSPFPYAIAAGNTFTVSAGCNKTMSNCTAFSNLANFGGEPYIPPPETVLV